MAHIEWKNSIGLVMWLRFDAIRTVEIQQSAQVTRHPVQKGSDIADHVRVEQPHVSITGYISIAPLTVDALVVRMKDAPIASGFPQRVALPSPPVGGSIDKYGASALQGGLLDAVESALSSALAPNSVESLITNSPGDRASEAASKLLELQEDAEMIRFVDELKTYEDMVITSVVGTRTAQFYGAAFQIELERVETVASQLVALPVPLEPRGQLEQKTASSPKSNPSTVVEDAQKSAALRMAQRLFSGIGGF